MDSLNSIARNPPPLNDMRKGLEALVSATVPDLILQIEMIDGQLGEINVLMSRLQPWHSGRIGIAMENTAHGRTVPSPRVYDWKHQMQSWNYDRVGAARLSQRVKKTGAFHENEKVVKELAKKAAFLMQLRTGLVEALMLFWNTTIERLKTAAVMSDYNKDLERITAEIDAKKHCTDFSSWRTDPGAGTEGS